MANVTINQLPTATPLSGSETAPLWQADQTVQASIADIVDAGLSDTGVTAGTYGASGASVPNVTVDAQGRLTAASNRTLTTSDINAVPTSREISAGTGLSGGGDLSANRTLSVADTGVSAATYGSSSTVPVVAVNAQGQITSATNTTITPAAIGAVPTSLTLTAGTGLTGGGDLTTNRSFALANTSVAAGTYGTNAETPRFTVDAQGRITLASTVPVVSLNITRAQIVTTAISVPCFSVAGYSTAGDFGAGAIYVSGTSGGPKAIQDAAGTWFNLVTFRDSRIEDWNTTANSATVAAAITYLEGEGGGVLRWGPDADPDPSTALTGTWPQFPTTTLKYDGEIPFSAFTDEPVPGAPDRAKIATRAQDGGSHSASKHAVEYLEYRPKGSGINGPASADYAHIISLIKHDWLNPAAEKGEIDAQYIVIRQGGPDAEANDDKSDAAATLADLTNIGNSGFIAYYEVSVSNIDRTTFLPTRQVAVQCAPINSVISGQQAYGHVYISKVGNGPDDVANYFKTEGTSRWGDIIWSVVASVGNWVQFKVSDLGKLTWRQVNSDAQTVTLEGDSDGALHTKKADGTTLFKVAQTGELTIRSTDSLSTTYRTVKVGPGYPESVVTGSGGDLYLRHNPTAATAAYLKFGDGTNTGWRPVSTRESGDTASRPVGLNTSTDRGYLYFDTTLGKPIFWNGTGWIDAAGTSV